MMMGRHHPAMICLVLAFLFIGINGNPAPAYAQPAAIAETQPAGQAETEPQDRKTSNQNELLDKTGGKIGQQVDFLSTQASSRVGPWINARVVGEITWLKTIFCLSILLLVLIFERLVRMTLVRAKKTMDDAGRRDTIKFIVLESITRPLSMFIYVYGTYFALTLLMVHFRSPAGTNIVYAVVQKAADVGAAVAIFWFIFKLISIVDLQLKKWATSTDSSIDDILVPIAGKTMRVLVIMVGGLLIVQNLTGVKIGPLLASLGIGGIAIALAAKDSIANFFGTLTILFDKPFQVGERVAIDGIDGVVEDVGVRSTRIRTLTGHLVTIPNEKVVNSALENIAKRPGFRWLTNLGLTYNTPPAKVERAVQIIESILKDHEGMDPEKPPRVVFNGFNEWSLNIMVIAWYHPPDYWAYQAWLQHTCLQIMEQFENEGIDFAFPSRTIYMGSQNVSIPAIGHLKHPFGKHPEEDKTHD
jgi:MscS family membrane protein